MPKVTLDMNTFKALASDTRLDILRTLDGKRMSLNDICKATRLNKATLHEHLTKLNEAGLVKRKEREGHKWVYYKLTWKGEGLLHPENTRIVVMFTTTFLALAVGIVQLINFVKGTIVAKAYNFVGADSTAIYAYGEGGGSSLLAKEFSQAPVGNVPLINQTTDRLSEAVVEKLYIKGSLGNEINPGDIGWTVAPDCPEPCNFLMATPDGAGAASETTTSPMLAIVHDPALQWIAIACIVIFSILLCVSIWRFRKNKKSKL